MPAVELDGAMVRVLVELAPDAMEMLPTGPLPSALLNCRSLIVRLMPSVVAIEVPLWPLALKTAVLARPGIACEFTAPV